MTNGDEKREEEERKKAEEERKEAKLDARTAYQVAGTLYMQENSVTWARFNAMVATNGIIVAATGLTMNSQKDLHVLAFALPVFGVMLCCIWFPIMWRGFAYLDVWRDSAYKIERKFLSGVTQALLKGDELSQGEKVEIEVQGRRVNPPHKAPPGKARIYASVVISLFLVLYLAAFVQAASLAKDEPRERVGSAAPTFKLLPPVHVGELK